MQVDLDDVTAMIRTQLGIPSVSGDARIVEDLGAESADIVNLIATVEDKYRISIDEGELPAVHTVADVVSLVTRHLETG